jgi:chemosensory pili system protein ChpA (sensor histidine kinase/response regulator)
MQPFCSLATPITRAVRASYTFGRSQCFKDETARRIAQMNLTILYAEDSQVVADAVKDLLTRAGYRVTACTHGVAALRELESSTLYDLLLLDHDLPGINGFQLIRHVRKLTHRRRTPIIMLSAGNYREDARRLGVSAFLQKPEGVNDLLSTIARLLNQDA